MKKILDWLFETGTKVLPGFMRDDSRFAAWITELLWIDCPYCLGMRFAFLGAVFALLLDFALRAVL